MKKKIISILVPVVLFAAFAVMFVVGAKSPEADIVFTKAVNICLQCIGLG